jgi:transposase
MYPRIASMSACGGAKPEDTTTTRPSSSLRDDAGIDALVTRLVEECPVLVIVEASGGFERAVVWALAAAGLPVAVVNPRQVRDFARATGRLAKTDTLDAEVLARFAQAIQPTPKPLPDEEIRALQGILARRRQLLGMLTAENNRLHFGKQTGSQAYFGSY